MVALPFAETGTDSEQAMGWLPLRSSWDSGSLKDRSRAMIKTTIKEVIN